MASVMPVRCSASKVWISTSMSGSPRQSPGQGFRTALGPCGSDVVLTVVPDATLAMEHGGSGDDVVGRIGFSEAKHPCGDGEQEALKKWGVNRLDGHVGIGGVIHGPPLFLRSY